VAKAVPPKPVVAKAAVVKPVEKPAVEKPVAEKPVAEKPAVEKPAAAKPAVEEPVAEKRAVEKPVDKPAVEKPLIADPAPLKVMTPSPVSVFRPSLRAPERSRLGRRLNGRHPALVTQTDPSSVEANAYRTLRANIELMADNVGFRNIAITSASGGDGKSTTAANLAVVAAQSGRRVCLVDADLRRPTLHDVFGLPNFEGLTVALEHGKPLSTVARAADVENLSVVVAGRGSDGTSHDLLTAQRLQKTLEGSEAPFDLVIFDSPPVMSVADALSVAAVCDGVILVVRAGSIAMGVIGRTIGQIRHVKGRVLGVLLNQVDLRQADASYQYDRVYHASTSQS
jgi:capsular exopolysaccharide synthesis family protein